MKSHMSSRKNLETANRPKTGESGLSGKEEKKDGASDKGEAVTEPEIH
jgi:hypothetical protein